jgi:hypothetical protein
MLQTSTFVGEGVIIERIAMSRRPGLIRRLREPNGVLQSFSKPQKGGGGKRSNVQKSDNAKVGETPHSPLHNVTHGEANFAS